MKKIKRIVPMSLGRMLGLMYALMGLIFGGLFALFTGIGGALAPEGASKFSLFFGAGAIIMIPLFYGIAGFLLGLLSGWLYNLAANWVGGIEIEFEEVADKAKTE